HADVVLDRLIAWRSERRLRPVALIEHQLENRRATVEEDPIALRRNGAETEIGPDPIEHGRPTPQFKRYVVKLRIVRRPEPGVRYGEQRGGARPLRGAGGAARARHAGVKIH